MKKILTESDIRKIIKRTLNESNVDVSGIVHRHIDLFVNDTVDKFLDVMDDISKELMEHDVIPAGHFAEVEMHFEKEMLNLGEEIIHKIHEDEEIQHHSENHSIMTSHGEEH